MLSLTRLLALAGSAAATIYYVGYPTVYRAKLTCLQGRCGGERR